MFYEQKGDELSLTRIDELWENVHCHDEVEIIIPINGTADAYVNTKKYKINSNELIVAFPNQVHSYMRTFTGDFCILIFSASYIPKLKKYVYSQTSGLKIDFADKPRIKSIVENLIDNCSDENFYSYVVAHRANDNAFVSSTLIGYVNLLMSEIMRYTERSEVNVDNAVFQKLFDYCSNNYQSNLSLDLVAQEIAESKWKITRSLKSTIGLSLPEFINYLRISNACNLLKNTDYSITRISTEVGFDSQRNFNRMFKRFISKTPSEFRNKNIK